jgi:hypothetical protein
MSAMTLTYRVIDLLCRILITIPTVLGWAGGLVPIRNPFFALSCSTGTGSVADIQIYAPTSTYTVWSIFINALSLAATVDDIFNGPGHRDTHSSEIKHTVLQILEHIFHAVLFSIRFYFAYRGRDLLRLYRRISELAGRSKTARFSFQLPAIILVYLLARICIRIPLEARYTMNVLNMSPRTTKTYLEELFAFCGPCEWTVHSILIAFPYFLTVVVPMHFAVTALIPLTVIFKNVYAQVSITGKDISLPLIQTQHNP